MQAQCSKAQQIDHQLSQVGGVPIDRLAAFVWSSGGVSIGPRDAAARLGAASHPPSPGAMPVIVFSGAECRVEWHNPR